MSARADPARGAISNGRPYRDQLYAMPFVRPSVIYAQRTFYGLTVATPSDSVVCKVESWRSQLTTPVVKTSVFEPLQKKEIDILFTRI